MSLVLAKQTYPGSKQQPLRHIPALDGIRGVAAATIFLYHYGGGAHSSNAALHIVGETLHLGWAGVSLFFVLSGFLITRILLSLMERPDWLRTFYIRRTLRIFPLYYFALLAVTLVNVSLKIPWSSISAMWPFFFYLQDFPRLFRFDVLGPTFRIDHLWSLAVEEQFYLAWPFLLLLASKRRQIKQLCLVVFLASLLFRACIFGFHVNTAWAAYSIMGRAGEMAAGGFVTAWLHDSQPARGQFVRGARLLLVASAAGLLTIIFATKELDARFPWLGTLGIALFSQMFAALIALCLQPGITQRIFSVAIFRWLGKLSYGIYVYHLLLYPVFVWLTHRLLPNSDKQESEFLLALIATVGTLAAAWLSFLTFETWFLRLKDSLGKPRAVGARQPPAIPAD